MRLPGFVSSLRLGLVGVAALLASSAKGADSCVYEIYQPQNIQRELAQSLPDLGVAAVSGQYAIAGLSSAVGRTHLLRGQMVVGQSAYWLDTKHDATRFAVFDLRGQALLDVTERSYPCPVSDPVGLCHEVDIETTHDASPVGTAFAVISSPDRPVEYFRYGKRVGWYDFRTQLWSSLNWLRATLSNSQDGLLLAPEKKTDRFFWAIAADPMVAPYLSRLTILDGGQRMIIRGVVPSNEVWDRILIDAGAAGFWAVDPQMTIDTGTLIVEPDFPRLGLCLPQ